METKTINNMECVHGDDAPIGFNYKGKTYLCECKLGVNQELLEACRIKVSECPYCRGDFDIECQTCHHMKAAIAKAEGR